ncbi:hypothetical protein I3843_15G116500 [Carya illinoinensis]|uniref:Uncharacterized protein n=1 Tax=Carya illinoinensis TaxID=32201 RepID=A0A8T1ND96_CARIL|nr:hypothetical protein I3760_15G119800 [Carya illinoinensis]KAG6627558.1 hypothetical protein CIPAW_15G137500 [Carya illinoinensis]KAG7944699.1 hypothetical protein I3843_15G116500 [Carya illinoinensis]
MGEKVCIASFERSMGFGLVFRPLMILIILIFSIFTWQPTQVQAADITPRKLAVRQLNPPPAPAENRLRRRDPAPPSNWDAPPPAEPPLIP